MHHGCRERHKDTCRTLKISMIVENLSQKELFLFLIVIISFLIVKAFGFILHNFYL